MAWLWLLVAGLLEVVWAYFMKRSDGFTRFVPSMVTIAAMIASVLLLSVAMKSLPLGTAYAIWTGIGALGAFLVGTAILGEPATTMRCGAVALVVVGLVMMKMTS